VHFLATLPFVEILLKLKEAAGLDDLLLLGKNKDKPCIS
jgi:hypothetical protein